MQYFIYEPFRLKSNETEAIFLDAIKKTIKKANLAGFCYGVKRAVDLTLDIKDKNPETKVYIFGELIHNNQVINQLTNLGIITITNIDEIQDGQNSICIIRTHGATPQDIKRIKEKGCEILDTTCLDVKKVQEKAKSLIQEGYKLIIIGKSDHPEVVGIKAHAEENTKEEALVLATEQEALENIDKIKSAKKIGIVIQTTQKTENLQKILPIVAEHAKELRVFNTICKTTSNRQTEAKNMAQEVDLMVVVGSKSSANTSHLSEILCEITNTILVENEQELEQYSDMIKNADKIGITAGASTPEDIINKVINFIQLKGE
ncbi:MAG: 4-hydroxy-3-methylbut-2-enyl diphosphate reductase [Candidatus Gastranaerophilales bacterium]|nr:4-hydroxy-3-methylbut-2-enyl diphosphate reductase [Candidatus Gastranaerophilales bacterium]